MTSAIHARFFFCFSLLFLTVGACYPDSSNTMPKTTLDAKNLQCAYRSNPLGIDSPKPRFSWLLQSVERCQVQSAYQVLVASSEQKLAAGVGDKWDSGKVDSDTSVNVVYEGTPLSSGEQCWWKVRCWDKNGTASAWSETAMFEMGLLTRDAWHGEWIGVGICTEDLNFITGKFGKAFKLNGYSESIKITHYEQLKPSKHITLCAWIQPEEYSDHWREIYRKEDGDARQLLAIGEDAGIKGIWFGLGINGAYIEHGAPMSEEVLMDGNWHFIAATYDGSSMALYFDGKKISGRHVTGPIDTDGSQPAFIGSWEGRAEFFPGGIDDVRIYNRALSAQEIQSMAGKRTGGDPSLVGWWPLDGDLKNNIDGIESRVVGGAIAAPLLRKECALAKKVKLARAYISGLGWYELYINGEKVGDHVLDPATTDYHKRTLYVTYDVTDRLHTGTNALGIILGNGWYCEPGRLIYGDSPKLLMQVHIEFTDGTSTNITTDTTWMTIGGPITFNNIYGGEVYDARREKPGWTMPGYDDSGWTAAEAGEGPCGTLQSQIMPAIKVAQTIKPVKLTNPKPGVYVYDLGQLFGGWSRLHVSGPKGTEVAIKYAARLFEDSGLVDKRRHGSTGETDHYVLKGEGREVYEPRFTYHPVRYVQIEGYPGTPTIDDLEGRVVHSDINMFGNFECSNPLLNQIHSNVVWTLRNGLFGIPLDCLHREHWAWTDPATITGNLYPRKFMPLFWTKWLNDIADAQHEDGGIPDVAPSYAFNQVDPAWGGNYPLLVWYLYQYYGDRRIVEDHYDGMKKLVDYLASHAERYIVTEGHFGDHMLPGEKPGTEEFISGETPPQLVWSGYFYRGALVVSRAARLLSKPGDAEKYETLAENIKKAFNEKWLDKETGVYAGGVQTANIFPLALDIVPRARVAGVLKNLVHSITQKYNGHLHTGNTGTTCMIDTLPRLGYGDLLYRVVNQTTYPGWGYMVAQGATTIWESWSLVAGCGNSESMIMWATIDEFFFHDLAGISGPEYYGDTDVESGFREIHIKPLVPDDLTYVQASILTVRGVVSSEWNRNGNSLTLKVILPVNSKGTVSVPKLGLTNVSITEGGKQLWQNGAFIGNIGGITSGTDTGDYITFTVGSGSYEFQVNSL
jgi:alpha-L-rhamnosidase